MPHARAERPTSSFQLCGHQELGERATLWGMRARPARGPLDKGQHDAALGGAQTPLSVPPLGPCRPSRAGRGRCVQAAGRVPFVGAEKGTGKKEPCARDSGLRAHWDRSGDGCGGHTGGAPGITPTAPSTAPPRATHPDLHATGTRVIWKKPGFPPCSQETPERVPMVTGDKPGWPPRLSHLLPSHSGCVVKCVQPPRTSEAPVTASLPGSVAVPSPPGVRDRGAGTSRAGTSTHRKWTRSWGLGECSGAG